MFRYGSISLGRSYGDTMVRNGSAVVDGSFVDLYGNGSDCCQVAVPRIFTFTRSKLPRIRMQLRLKGP
jgi:hypothetical protein